MPELAQVQISTGCLRCHIDIKPADSDLAHNLSRGIYEIRNYWHLYRQVADHGPLLGDWALVDERQLLPHILLQKIERASLLRDAAGSLVVGPLYNDLFR